MSVDDWMQHIDLLPARPETFIEAKYLRYFATDVQGHAGHDQYVFMAQNGLAVVGLAPSHPLIAEHRKLNKYTPLIQTTVVDSALMSLIQTPGSTQLEEEGPGEAAGGGGSSNPDHQDAARPAKRSKATPAGEAAQDESPAAAPGPAESFPLEQLKSISYMVGKKDRSSIKTSGKSAAGSFMAPNSTLCTISSKGNPPRSALVLQCHASMMDYLGLVCVLVHK